MEKTEGPWVQDSLASCFPWSQAEIEKSLGLTVMDAFFSGERQANKWSAEQQEAIWAGCCFPVSSLRPQLHLQRPETVTWPANRLGTARSGFPPPPSLSPLQKQDLGVEEGVSGGLLRPQEQV